jgi:flagellin-like hook-associated protein FlgL
MSFAINTNLGALQAYNALAKVNSEAIKAQTRLSTLKKINHVADDTSGYRVGKELEGNNIIHKADLNNGSSAKNYVQTAETSLLQINDLLNNISAKYQDSLDPTKDKGSIAKDINAMANEIDSILKSTNINGHNVLAQSDGSALASNDSFYVGGDITMDFAGDSYLKVGDLETILNGGTIEDPGVHSYVGQQVDLIDPYSGPDQSSTITATFADGTVKTTTFQIHTGDDFFDDIIVPLRDSLLDNLEITTGSSWSGATPGHLIGNYTIVQSYQGSNIVSLETTSGFDLTTLLGMTRHSSSTSTGGLLSADADTALAAANNLTTVTNNVKVALGRIGNLSQTLDSRTDFITSSITNNDASISHLFDADMAMEELNSTKSSIGSQVGTLMLSQLNSSPQQVLSLFR